MFDSDGKRKFVILRKAAPTREDVTRGDVTREMARFEAAYPCVDHTKYSDGEVIAGRVRYAEPDIDKMFSAWLSSACHRLAHTARPDAGEGCKHCGGNGYSGGVVPKDPELCDACEVCLGSGKSRPDAGDEDVERVAQFLHDEGGFGDAMNDRTWPEHPDDTGQREGGWVKIVPSDVQAKFRDVARRLLLPPSPAAMREGVDRGMVEVPVYVDLPPIWHLKAENALGNTGSAFGVHPRVRGPIAETVWNVMRDYFRTEQPR